MAFLLVTMLCARAARGEMTPPVVYTGTWQVQDNGDVKITCTFKLTLQGYVYCKEHNVAMLTARNFATNRAAAEFTDVKADWDDMKRILTLSMTGLGFAHNSGKHWDVKIQPDISFSNINAGTRTAYFSWERDGPMGHIVGHDEIVFPAASSKLVWEPGANTVSYVQPPSYHAPRLFLVLGIVSAVIGVGVLAASYLVGLSAKPQAVSAAEAARSPAFLQ
jgi:hypothetical protein